MDTLALLHGALVERQEAGNTLVGVVDTHEGGLDFLLELEVFIDQNDGGLGRVEVMCVLGIGKERDGAGNAFFYFGKGGYLGFGVAFNGSA